jgi:8-oxo-dGTP diphosphatase
MTKVDFYNPDFEPEDRLIYSLICARYMGKWVFVRHHSCNTYEIPAGHIETEELPLQTAKRELWEETGAIQYTIECIATYSVTKENYKGWGRLYFAEITSMGPFPDVTEISEVILSDDFPTENTYPDIQPLLFKRALSYICPKSLTEGS